MVRYPLHTYTDIKEFNLFYKDIEDLGKVIYPFIFQETADLIEENSDSIIDISSLVNYLMKNPADTMAAINNFAGMDENTKIIVKECLVDDALNIFATLFDEKVPLFHKEIEQDIESVHEEFTPFKRYCLYAYDNENELTSIIKYLNDNYIKLVNFSEIDNQFIEKIKQNKNYPNDLFVDITSLVIAIKDNVNIIYLAEQYFNSIGQFTCIILENEVNNALAHLRMVFDHSQHVSNIVPVFLSPENEMVNSTIKITDLNDKQLEELLSQVSTKLYGHQRFKDRFTNDIKNFLFLNKIGEKKVFSAFLLGPSGLGKTEFAKIIKDYLCRDTSLIKINFGNYSSQDSLNSLIGSPKGYIGSTEGGELSVKINKSRAGVILCDEFEKATLPIFNFFLELLEDGLFTDSISREHDIDGYIIIFTSNLDASGFYKSIPPELQSRLDLVCEFQPLSKVEKQNYINNFVDTFIEKLKKQDLHKSFTEDEITDIRSKQIDTDNLREIKRIMIDTILKSL